MSCSALRMPRHASASTRRRSHEAHARVASLVPAASATAGDSIRRGLTSCPSRRLASGQRCRGLLGNALAQVHRAQPSRRFEPPVHHAPIPVTVLAGGHGAEEPHDFWHSFWYTF